MLPRSRLWYLINHDRKHDEGRIVSQRQDMSSINLKVMLAYYFISKYADNLGYLSLLTVGVADQKKVRKGCLPQVSSGVS